MCRVATNAGELLKKLRIAGKSAPMFTHHSPSELL
jgi:hypothetical protein